MSVLHACLWLVMLLQVSMTLNLGSIQAIIVDQQQQAEVSTSNQTSHTQSTQNNNTQVNIEPSKSSEGGESSETFHYEANEFLISSNGKGKTKQQPKMAELVTQSPETRLELSKIAPAANMSSTSSRNGRMLDLDALMGDYAQSQANKERSLTGNRQSRYVDASAMAGKKLHIQGYIPIVGIKPDDSSDSAKEDPYQSTSIQEDAKATRQRHQLQSLMGHPNHNHNNNYNQMLDNPYGQATSLGHASLGVQRYLNTDIPSQQVMGQPSAGSGLSKSGHGVVETLKKPFKLLTGGYQQQQQPQQQQQQQNEAEQCLCVPFYMCKNGYITDSAATRQQLQQYYQQQQAQMAQQPRELDGQPQPLTQQQQQPQLVTQTMASASQQYADSLVPVDERSFEMSQIGSITLEATSQSQSNNTSSSSTPQEVSVQTGSQLSQAGVYQQAAQQVVTGVSNSSEPTDYSQEILGRMLGLKAPGSGLAGLLSHKMGAQASGGSGQPGSCGLLRTCCQIASASGFNNGEPELSTAQMTMAQSQASMFVAPPVQAMHKFQPMVSSSDHRPSNGLPSIARPFGLPSTAASQQQVQYSLPPNQMEMTMLIHRSNQQQQQLQAQPFGGQLGYQLKQQPLQHVRGSASPVSLSRMHPGASNLQIQAAPPTSSARQQAFNGQLGTRNILDGRCGLRQSVGITGRVQSLQYHDSSADFGEYPSQVAILKRMSNTENLFVCGGTLISQYWVATAAHCIKKHPIGELKVRLGEWDVHRDDEFYPFVEREIRDLVVHPEFVAGNLINDIALLRLDSPVESNLPHVNPACLPAVDESFVRQRCWVTGWGKDSFGHKGSFQSVLREVELPVVAHADCEHALRQTRLGPHYRLHSSFVCAGGEGGRDACEGDGGSGLFCVQPDGLIKVAGLVSWGIGCGQHGVPGVYISMAHFRPWIENIISIDEDIYGPHTNMVANNLISERSNPAAPATSNISSLIPPQVSIAQDEPQDNSTTTHTTP